MGANTGQGIPIIPPGAIRNHEVSFIGQLDSGELLSGTPTIAEQTTSDLAITNEQVNTSALTIQSASVAIGQAVQCRITGQAVNTSYKVKITVSTDATPVQTLIAYIEFDCRAR